MNATRSPIISREIEINVDTPESLNTMLSLISNEINNVNENDPSNISIQYNIIPDNVPE
tara:strand:- start:1723 stop:1899 length:177 start_codon:yes stop_codon:yes gene_type:complete